MADSNYFQQREVRVAVECKKKKKSIANAPESPDLVSIKSVWPVLDRQVRKKKISKIN